VILVYMYKLLGGCTSMEITVCWGWGKGVGEGHFEQVRWDGNRTNIRGFGQNMFAAS
jgi:hypothetical protein